MKPSRRALTILAAACTAAAFAWPAAGQPAVAQPAAPSDLPVRVADLPLKAGFLTRFPAFATWPGEGVGLTARAASLPAKAAPSPKTAGPTKICIVGEDPFGPVLEQTLTREASVTPVVLRRLPVVERGSDCHIVYLSGSPEQSVAQALEAVKGAAFLTVTDADRGEARGMIHFVVFQDRVRFQVDLTQTQPGGVALSSKLLALALSVKR